MEICHNLPSFEEAIPIDSLSGRFQYILPTMAEGRRDIVIVNNDAPETGPPMGLTNNPEAEAYHAGIEKIMDDFRELLNEDRKGCTGNDGMSPKLLIYTAQLLNCFQCFYPGLTEFSLESHIEQRIFPTEY